MYQELLRKKIAKNFSFLEEDKQDKLVSFIRNFSKKEVTLFALDIVFPTRINDKRVDANMLHPDFLKGFEEATVIDQDIVIKT